MSRWTTLGRPSAAAGRVRARRLSAIGWPRGRSGIARRRNHVPPSVSSPGPRATKGRPAGCWSGCCWRAVSRCRLSMPGPRTCRRARPHAALRRSAPDRHQGAPGFLRRSAMWAAAGHPGRHRVGRQVGHVDVQRHAGAGSLDGQVLAAGATWTGVRPDGSTIFPTNVSGIGIRLRAGPGDSASEVQATTAIRAVLNIDQLIMLANMQMAPYILQVSLRVELVKMGSDVLPGIGAFPVTGMATAYQGASMRFKGRASEIGARCRGTDLGPITDRFLQHQLRLQYRSAHRWGRHDASRRDGGVRRGCQLSGQRREVPMGPVTRGSFPGRGDRSRQRAVRYLAEQLRGAGQAKISFSPGFQGRCPAGPMYCGWIRRHQPCQESRHRADAARRSRQGGGTSATRRKPDPISSFRSMGRCRMARRPPWNWRRIMCGPTMKAKGRDARRLTAACASRCATTESHERNPAQRNRCSGIDAWAWPLGSASSGSGLGRGAGARTGPVRLLSDQGSMMP